MPQVDYFVNLRYLEMTQLIFCFLMTTDLNNDEKFENEGLVHLITCRDRQQLQQHH